MKMLLRGLSPEKWIATCQLLLMLNLFATTNGWFALTNVLELILWCIVLFVGRVRRAIFSISDVRLFCLLAFLGWVAVAMFWGQAPFAERLDELLSWRKIVLFPIALALFTTRESKLLFLKVLIFWVSAYGLASWLLFITNSDASIDPAYLLENDVVQAIFFSFAALSIFILWADGAISENMVLWAMLFIVLVSNVFMVATGRSGYLFFVVGFLVAACYLATGRRVAVLGALILITVSGFLISDRPSKLIMQGVDEVLAHGDPAAKQSSMGIRVVMWEHTFEVIQASPLLGSGSGSFYLAYADAVKDEKDWRAVVSDDPHNQYLHLWAEQGLVGLLLFLAFLLLCLVSVPAGAFGVLASCLIAGISATSMFSGHFSTFVEGRLFWMMLGICLSGSTLSIRDLLTNRKFGRFK